jgi:hypothetical protein
VVWISIVRGVTPFTGACFVGAHASRGLQYGPTLRIVSAMNGLAAALTTGTIKRATITMITIGSIIRLPGAPGES